jgi:hypothetical protein
LTIVPVGPPNQTGNTTNSEQKGKDTEEMIFELDGDDISGVEEMEGDRPDALSPSKSLATPPPPIEIVVPDVEMNKPPQHVTSQNLSGPIRSCGDYSEWFTNDYYSIGLIELRNMKSIFLHLKGILQKYPIPQHSFVVKGLTQKRMQEIAGLIREEIELVNQIATRPVSKLILQLLPGSGLMRCEKKIDRLACRPSLWNVCNDAGISEEDINLIAELTDWGVKQKIVSWRTELSSGLFPDGEKKIMDAYGP